MNIVRDRSFPRLTAGLLLLCAGGVTAQAAPAGAVRDGQRGSHAINDAGPPAEYAAGPLLHVDVDAQPGGNGTSWVRAYNTLQDALDDARRLGSGVNQILVAQGIYRPDRGAGQASGDRTATFALVNGVEMLGGFAGLGTPSPYERNIAAFPTILSGDLAANDQPNFVNNSENSYTVVTGSGVGSSAILDGFVITGGNANGPDTGPLELTRGGGIWNLTGSPTFVDCTIRDNSARYHGGGMYNRINSRPTIERCTFSGNRAELRAGGVFNAFGSDATIIDSVFTGNVAGSNGGAINIHESSPLITGSSFSDNVAGEGGAINGHLAGIVTIESSVFERNAASTGGGAVRVSDACALVVRGSSFLDGSAIDAGAIFIGATSPAADVRNSFFLRNLATGRGGAIYDAAASRFVNGAFSQNVSTNFGSGTGGGAAYMTDSSSFVNCTISRNSGCALHSSTIGPAVVNSIIWANDPQQILDDGAASTIAHTNIQGGWSGPGSDIMNIDPCFVHAGEDNIRLGEGSPCLNEGDNGEIPSGVTTDLDGNPRIVDGVVDLGAYEGEQEFVPLIAEDLDFDNGERALLVPSGGVFDPASEPAVKIVNVDGADNAMVRVSETYKVLHPDAGGFSELGAILDVETSLADGETFATIYIPFWSDALPGIDALELDLTYFDAATGNWALAVSRNVGASPGHSGVIGDRIAVVSVDGGGFTNDLGDYGVFLNPITHRGVVWANVDHAAQFAIGVPVCPADAEQPPNSTVDMSDVLVILKNWARGAGPYDVNNDGIVNGFDLTEVFAAWGVCRP